MKSTPNLYDLRQALMAPMPEGFTWNFDTVYGESPLCDKEDCGTVGCALGLAYLLWPEHIERSFHLNDIMKAFGLGHSDVGKIFYGLHPMYAGLTYDQITPQHVAEVIGEYISTHEIKYDGGDDETSS